MTDHPTDTDIIAEAVEDALYDLGIVDTADNGQGDLYSVVGDQSLTDVVDNVAAHVAEALTAARTIATVADRLRAGADAADRADEALDLLNDTLPTGRILALKLTLDDIADRLRQRADELDPPDSKDQP